jgi:hypothetical protein
MGSSYSTQDEKPNTTDKVENVKRLFNVDDDDDFLETLNMSDFNLHEKKMPLPIIGGTQNYQDDEPQFVDFNLVGGSQQNDIRFMSNKRRYLRHNIFKILDQLNQVDKSQKGGNQDEDEQYLSTSSDDDAIKNIKNIILREVNKLNSDSNNQLGGDCGCDGNKGALANSDNDQHGGAKKKSKKVKKTTKKNKKSKKTQKGGSRNRKQDKKKEDSTSSSSSSSSSDDSEDSYNSKNDSSLNQSESSLDSRPRRRNGRRNDKKEETEETETDTDTENKTDTTDSKNTSSSSNRSNETDDSDDTNKSEGSQKGGLSIFPFNSSEIKSTVSEKKNMRMIRRKI